MQYGFRVPPGTVVSSLGIDAPAPATGPVPAAEQAAVSHCAAIIRDFTTAAQGAGLAFIATLSNVIYRDVRQDAAVRKAARAWSACMAKNGYRFGQPQDVFSAELQETTGGQPPAGAGGPVSAAASKAQLAVAVSDAGCTQSADLAGIYFAVEASYEQQLVNANQLALTAAVRRFRSAYAGELRKLRPQLRTASAKPAPTHARRSR